MNDSQAETIRQAGKMLFELLEDPEESLTPAEETAIHITVRKLELLEKGLVKSKRRHS